MTFKYTIEDLIKFLYNAKLNTFSSDLKPDRKEDGSRIYSFEENNFNYQDKYYGNIIDAGQEIVWYKNSSVWTMSYRGGMLSHEELSKKCFRFLKKSLQRIPQELPIRGPKFFKEEPFKYINSIEGNILDFTGQESILFNEEQIYFRNYLGGIIKLEN